MKFEVLKFYYYFWIPQRLFAYRGGLPSLNVVVNTEKDKCGKRKRRLVREEKQVKCIEARLTAKRRILTVERHSPAESTSRALLLMNTLAVELIGICVFEESFPECMRRFNGCEGWGEAIPECSDSVNE